MEKLFLSLGYHSDTAKRMNRLLRRFDFSALPAKGAVISYVLRMVIGRTSPSELYSSLENVFILTKGRRERRPTLAVLRLALCSPRIGGERYGDV